MVNIKKKRTFATLYKTKPLAKELDLQRFTKQSLLPKSWKGGRVVDYSGLENRRAERHRGFESLPFRKDTIKIPKTNKSEIRKKLISLLFYYPLPLYLDFPPHTVQ